MVGPDKCQRRGRLGRRNPHSDSEEQPKCAALPPQRGPGDLRLTRQGKRHRFSGEDEAQNGNSGSGIYLGAKGTGYASYQQQSLLALTMGFIGGYTWSVQYIFRRFVTIDLPPRAYYSIGIRMILAALVALMIRHFLEATPGSEYTSGMIPVVAFLTGMFPERALHYLNRNFHFELHLHPKTYASYPVVSIANRPGLFEVVVRHISAVLRSRCAGFACPACLAADTYPARPLLST